MTLETIKHNRPVPPPNQWVRKGRPIAFDIVTGDPQIDREIARNRGLLPLPWWRRLFSRRGAGSTGTV